MQRNSTIGELMERKRIQDGAKEYQGHTYMDLARFDDATKHMIIFDVLTDESPVGWKGERNRLYLSDVGYQKALDNQKAGNIKIISHAAVAKGNLYYDHRDMRKNEKITALYERLSRDDFGKDDDQQRESNSISNQKAMLEEFAARQGFTNIVHFTDDGISCPM